MSYKKYFTNIAYAICFDAVTIIFAKSSNYVLRPILAYLYKYYNINKNYPDKIKTFIIKI